MMSLIAREFGSYVWEPVEKGENIAWFTDQRLISVLLADACRVSLDGAPRLNVSYVGRNTNTDRVDLARWNSLSANEIVTGVTIEAHLPYDGYRSEAWIQIRPLVEALHRKQDEHVNSEWLSWSTMYVDDFRRLSSRVTAV